MKEQILYTWTDSDGSLIFAGHALNRLASFQTDAEREEGPKYVNSVLKGNMFSQQDLHSTANYLVTLAARARIKWNMVGSSPNLTERDYANSIIQAADFGEQAASDLVELFNTSKPTHNPL